MRHHMYMDEINIRLYRSGEAAIGFAKAVKPSEAIYHVDVPDKELIGMVDGVYEVQKRI